MEQVLHKIYNLKHIQIQRNKLQKQLQLNKRVIGRKYKGSISKQYEQPYTPSTDFSLEQEYKFKRELSFGNSFLLLKQNQNQIDLQVYKSHQQTFHLPKVQKKLQQTFHLPTVQRMSQTKSQKSNSIFKQSSNKGFKQTNNNAFKQTNNKLYKQSRTSRLRSKQVSINKKSDRNLKLLFRAKVFAIIFILKLRKNYRSILMINKTQVEKYASQFLSIVNKTVNLYYVPLLKNQINVYFTLLQMQIRKPGARLIVQIMNLVQQMAAKLAKSTIRKDLLHFFSLVSNQNSFFPSDFLSQPQINRLNFNPKLSCLQNITQDQSRMIVATCLGIKIFCVYVIYKPWLLNFQHLNVTSNTILKYYKRAKKLIFQVGSIFYNIIIQQYLQILEVKTKQKDKIKLLKQFQLSQLSIINVAPQHLQILQEEEQQKQKEQIHIIKNQNKDFYSQLENQFPEKLKQVRINIIKWLDRIYLGVKNYTSNQLNNKRQKIKKDKLIIQKKLQQFAFNQKLQQLKW